MPRPPVNCSSLVETTQIELQTQAAPPYLQSYRLHAAFAADRFVAMTKGQLS